MSPEKWVVKIINTKTNEVVEEYDVGLTTQIIDKCSEMSKEYVAVIGKGPNAKNISGIRTAYQEIPKIKAGEEDEKLLNHYYFSIIDGNLEENIYDTPVVILTSVNYWDQNKEIPNTGMTYGDELFLEPFFKRNEFRRMNDFIYVSHDYTNEESKLYDELLEMGLCFSDEFDEYVNNNVSKFMYEDDE